MPGKRKIRPNELDSQSMLIRLNKIVDSQSVFFNTKRERDRAVKRRKFLRQPTSKTKPWRVGEDKIIFEGLDKPIEWTVKRLRRTYSAIITRRKIVRASIV